MTGGTVVTVKGANFIQNDSSICKFGNAPPAKGHVISPSALRCVSPPHESVQSVQNLSALSALPTGEVQVVTLALVSTFAGPPPLFQILFDGFSSKFLLFTATASGFTQAFQSIPTAGNVSVSKRFFHRVSSHTGISWNISEWTVQFLTRLGDAPPLALSFAVTKNFTQGVHYDFSISEKVPGNSGGVFSEVQKIKTSQRAVLPEIQVLTVRGSSLVNEIQAISLVANNMISGKWLVQYNKSSSALIEWDASSTLVQAALQGLPGLGSQCHSYPGRLAGLCLASHFH